MRIYSVTPIHVGAAELARRQARYDALCPPGLEVELHDIGASAPKSLETADDVRASEELVVEALRAAPAGFDALLPDCVLDPGVEALSRELPAPVLGLLRISLGWAVCTGRRSGAVARNKAIADEIKARVDAYGWGAELAGVEVLDLDADAITDSVAWTQALTSAQGRLRQSGATLVVNGCSAVELAGTDDDPGMRIVDPTALTLRLVAAAAA
jgi:allantoin racemase